MIALSQHCLPKDPEKINQCFAVFSVSSIVAYVCRMCVNFSPDVGDPYYNSLIKCT